MNNSKNNNKKVKIPNSVPGLGLASSQRRFIFNTGGQQPQSPFGGKTLCYLGRI
jgi:hypothetical protein